MKDFIGIYENAFSDEYCDRVVSQYENMIKHGLGRNRQFFNDQEKTKKDDISYSFPNNYGGLKDNDIAQDTIDQFDSDITNEFNSVFWGNIYPKYAEEYAILKEAGSHVNYGNKIQKTEVGGGYHIWHFESCDRQVANRLLTYILYLNDVDEGGETELLYYAKRIKPKKGTLVLFPAAFTHTHRGNPPLSNDKYVLTSWIEY